MSSLGPVVDNDVEKLAPVFCQQVKLALSVCNAAGLDAMVWEAYRSDELQEIYWHRGRPPTPEYPAPVTNARSNLYSWHGYYLAVDVISRSRKWFAPKKIVSEKPEDLEAERLRARREGQRWFADVASIFKRCGCAWGGDWKHPDPPHMQFGRCKPSPSDRARELIAAGGVQAVWEAVGAI